MRRKVRIQASISPAIDNKKVYFSWWDVDDPSSSPVIDTNGSTGNDNKGSGENLHATHAVTNSSGKAKVTFTVSMNPGDNFKIAASCFEDNLNEMTQAMADGQETLPAGVKLSTLLTTWRKLWIERDTMDTVASSGSQKNYVSGIASDYEVISTEPLRTRVYLGTNLPDELDDEDQFYPGIYDTPSKDYPVFCNSGHWWTEDFAEVSGNPEADDAGNSYDLYDDDYHPVTLVPRVTLPSYPDLGTYEDEFERAYIVPEYLDASFSDVVGFDRNLDPDDDVEWNAHFDNPPSSGFWSVLSVTSFQPVCRHDGDPYTTDLYLGEAKNSRNDLALYLEVIEHEDYNSADGIMAHEIGHTGGLEHCQDEECIMQTKGGDHFCDECLCELRQNGDTW